MFNPRIKMRKKLEISGISVLNIRLVAGVLAYHSTFVLCVSNKLDILRSEGLISTEFSIFFGSAKICCDNQIAFGYFYHF